MKNKFSMSHDDYSACTELANTLDEVYDHHIFDHTFDPTFDPLCDQNHQAKKQASKMKTRIPLVNKHTLNQQKAHNSNNKSKSKDNNSEFAELSKSQPFNVLSLYQEREKKNTSRYLSHGDFTEADGHITKKLRRRQVEVQAIIDLHNMTQEQAHRALNNFIISAHKNKYRVVRVITGKGKNGIGVIRKNIEEWINTHPIRPLVLGFAHAHKFDGGLGALNILLRR